MFAPITQHFTPASDRPFVGVVGLLIQVVKKDALGLETTLYGPTLSAVGSHVTVKDALYDLPVQLDPLQTFTAAGLSRGKLFIP